MKLDYVNVFKKMKFYYILIALVLFACKKEKIVPEEPITETPVFSVTGTVGTEVVNLQAGIDGAYMSTYTEMQNGVEVFTGYLQGNNAVKLGIHNGQIGQTDPGSAGILITGAFTDSMPDDLINLTTSSLSNASSIDYISYTVDGINIGNTLVIDEPGVYDVCSNVYFADGTNKEVCNEMILGYYDLDPFVLSHYSPIAGVLSANIAASTTISTVNWYIDGNPITEGTNLNVPISSGLHILKADVLFQDGIRRIRSVIVDGNNTDRYFEDITTYQTPIDPVLNYDYKAELEILLNGVVYRHKQNSGEGTITIQDIFFYGTNTAGHNVYKVIGTINTPVVSNTGVEKIANLNIQFGIEVDQ